METAHNNVAVTVQGTFHFFKIERLSVIKTTNKQHQDRTAVNNNVLAGGGGAHP